MNEWPATREPLSLRHQAYGLMKESTPPGWLLNGFPAQFLLLTQVTVCPPHPGLCRTWRQQ